MTAALRIDRSGLPANVERVVRQVQQSLDATVPGTLISVTDIYHEPFVITFSHEPAGLLMIRCRDDAAPEDSIGAAVMVDFVYMGGQIVVAALEGPVVGTKYRFQFLAVS